MYRLRRWSWDNQTHTFCRGGIVQRAAQLVSDCFFLYARLLDRNPRRCWAALAVWAMGYTKEIEGEYVLDDGACGWCGKHKRRP